MTAGAGWNLLMVRSSPPSWLSESWREYKELVAALSPVPLRNLLFHRHFDRACLGYAILGGGAAGAVFALVVTGHPLVGEVLSWLR